MLFSLIHTETGSSSQNKLFSFEAYRLLQSLFGYHYLTSSLMEEAARPTKQSPLSPGRRLLRSAPKKLSPFLAERTAPQRCGATRNDIKGLSLLEIIEYFQWTYGYAGRDII